MKIYIPKDFTIQDLKQYIMQEIISFNLKYTDSIENTVDPLPEKKDSYEVE